MYSRILIATDGSPLAEKGVDHALALANAANAEVIFLTVSEPWRPLGADVAGLGLTEYSLLQAYEKEQEQAGKDILAKAAGKAAAAGVKAKTVYVARKFPADAIVETADDEGADLVVMASHGRRGVQRALLGSQTNDVLTHSKVPVLVVR